MIRRVRWLIDGYNVIRGSAELSARERESLLAGREALIRLLARAARARGDHFTVVFDGAGGGGSAGQAGVRVIFSSARESADHVLARMATPGSSVVSNDREVRRAAARARAIPIRTDAFLARLATSAAVRPADKDAVRPADKDAEEEDRPSRPKKGNPRRLGKKARAAARALGRIGPRPGG